MFMSLTTNGTHQSCLNLQSGKSLHDPIKSPVYWNEMIVHHFQLAMSVVPQGVVQGYVQ